MISSTTGSNCLIPVPFCRGLARNAYTSFLHTSTANNVSTPSSGLYLISTFLDGLVNCYRERCVNALSGLYLISTTDAFNEICNLVVVSMPSRAYTSFLRKAHEIRPVYNILVSMPSRAYISFLRTGGGS